MTSSKWVRSRGVTRSSGSRGFFSPDSAAFFAAAFAFAACAFSARAAASGDLSTFAARSALSALSPLSFSLSAIDLDSRTLGNAHQLAIVALADGLETDARRLAVLGIGQRDIGQVDRHLLGDDAALLLRGLLLVALDHVDAAHERALLGRMHRDDLAAAAPVTA